MSAAAERPQPVPTPTTEAFWEATKRGVLLLQRCTACGEHQFYPRPVCTHCGGRELSWVEAAGTGTIYSFTVARRPTLPQLAPLVPYVIALVDLTEGPRMTAGVIGCAPEDVAIDMPVELTFEPLAAGTGLAMFRPTG